MEEKTRRQTFINTTLKIKIKKSLETCINNTISISQLAGPTNKLEPRFDIFYHYFIRKNPRKKSIKTKLDLTSI